MRIKTEVRTERCFHNNCTNSNIILSCENGAKQKVSSFLHLKLCLLEMDI